MKGIKLRKCLFSKTVRNILKKVLELTVRRNADDFRKNGFTG